jgi:DNA segregation ATPase FtsK/SpoIIIE-like protein
VTKHVAVGASVVADESAAAPMEAISEQTEAATATPVEAAVAIPRPDAVPARAASGLDEALVGEAVDLVTSARRANTVFLQRKLRVDYDVAAALLAELAARGVVALDADATHGRVLR